MDTAVKRLEAYNVGQTINSEQTATASPANDESQILNDRRGAKLRPWLQAFDLGAEYTPEMVHAQINAFYDAASSTPEFMNGYMLWNPSNVYAREAILP